MRVLYTGGRLYTGDVFDVAVADGRIERLDVSIDAKGYDQVTSLRGLTIFPGFADAHTHLREPGFSYKGTVCSETRAGARGGYTALCAMPNLNPAPDTVEHLEIERAIIRRDAALDAYPYAAITAGRAGQTLSDMDALAEFCVGFSDDGSGVQDENVMREAMTRARALDSIIAAHCEDNACLAGGYIHDGAYCRAHGHRGISSESEWRQVERDLRLALETGCRYHVCHVSTKESVALIRAAKARGADVSCETAPHYLLLCEDDLKEDGRFKMNPPLRARADRDALVEGVRDGTIDMIATDHAPHAAEEKNKGLAGSLMGVVGLETAFPMLFSSGLFPLKTLAEKMSLAPRARFRLPGGLAVGGKADFTAFDLDVFYDVPSAPGRATPFEGMRARGKCRLTVCGGREIYSDLARGGIR